jgi:hypothetical protein
MTPEDYKVIQSMMQSSGNLTPAARPPVIPTSTGFTPASLSVIEVGGVAPMGSSLVMTDDTGTVNLPVGLPPAHSYPTVDGANAVEPQTLNPSQVNAPTTCEDDDCSEFAAGDNVGMTDDEYAEIFCSESGAQTLVQSVGPSIIDLPAIPFTLLPTTTELPMPWPVFNLLASKSEPTVLVQTPGLADSKSGTLAPPDVTEGPSDEMALRACVEGWCNQLAEHLSMQTGFHLLANPNSTPRESAPVEKLLHRMRWSPNDLVEQSPEELVQAEMTLAAHLCFVQSQENLWKARLRFLSDELDRIMKIRRQGQNAAKAYDQEAMLLRSDPLVRKLHNQCTVARFGAAVLDQVGDRVTSLLNAIKPAVRLRCEQRTTSFGQSALA